MEPCSQNTAMHLGVAFEGEARWVQPSAQRGFFVVPVVMRRRRTPSPTRSGGVSLAVSSLAGIDVPALLQALDRYPYGCSEQIVSRALPLLYVNKLAKSEALGIDPDVDQRIREAIERVLARQDSTAPLACGRPLTPTTCGCMPSSPIS